MDYPNELSSKQIDIIKNHLLPELKTIGLTKENFEDEIEDFDIIPYLEHNKLDSLPKITNKDLGLSDDADYEERDEAFYENFDESEFQIVTLLVIDWLRDNSWDN